MDVKELESKTVAELKEMAKEAGITGISSMKKADLVAALAGAAPEKAAETVPEEAAAQAPAAEEAPAEEPAAEESVPEPEVEAAPAEEPAPEAVPGPAAEPAPEQAAEAAPEPEVEAAPEEAPAAKTAPAPAPAKKAEPAPEPPKPAAVPTRTQIRLQEKYDIPALKNEKRALQSQILAAIAAQDYKKLKELRSRKKELRRLLNRV